MIARSEATIWCGRYGKEGSDRLASGKRDECAFHLLPDAGAGIDDFKVSSVLKRDELNVFAGFFLCGGIRLADFVRD